MSDRVTIIDARKAYMRWVKAVGGHTTMDARANGWPITGSFHLEEWRIGDGKLTVRIAQITSESGAERAPMLEGRRSPREFVDMVSAAIATLEVKERMPRREPFEPPVLLPDGLVLTKIDDDPNMLVYRDQDGTVWSSAIRESGFNCAEIRCGRNVQAGYIRRRDDYPKDTMSATQPHICGTHVLAGGYMNEESGYLSMTNRYRQ
jgi:hypothetical protein